MALTELYVDPSIAGDSGSGTIGDPYGDLQYCLTTDAHDTTNGTRINIKAGTDEVLASELDWSSWGAPTVAAPLVIQGYTSAAGDGGVGGISGGGSYHCINNSNLDYVTLRHLHLHNSGANEVVFLDQNCNVINCEIETTTNDGVTLDSSGCWVGNYFHNIGDRSANMFGTGGFIAYNVFEDETNVADHHCRCRAGAVVNNNVFILKSGARAILAVVSGLHVYINNTIFAVSGTGIGIYASVDVSSGLIVNNVIEGFSGTGGDGIEIKSGEYCNAFLGYNAFYNNTANKTNITAATAPNQLGGDLTPSASPFVDAANSDFRIRPGSQINYGGYPSSYHASCPLVDKSNYPGIGAIDMLWSMRRRRLVKYGA